MSKFSEQVKIETIDKINDSARSILTAPLYLVEEGDNDKRVIESCVTQAYWEGVEDGIKVAYDEIAIQNLKMTWRPVSTRPKYDGFYLAIVATPSDISHGDWLSLRGLQNRNGQCQSKSGLIYLQCQMNIRTKKNKEK